MISTDFAPNTSWIDALLSIKILLNPFGWYEEGKIKKAKKKFAEVTGETDEKVELYYNGRSALYWLLKDLNLEENESILVTGYTCVAVVLPLISLKLNPLFVDIETLSFGMDYTDFVKNYDQSKRKPKVCILQHTYGILPISREKIMNFCEKNDIFLIEDLAHGFDWDTIKDWQRPKNGAWLFSFGRSKMISSVDGGAVIKFGEKIYQENINHPISKQPKNLLMRLILYNILAVTIKSTYDLYLGKILHWLFRNLGLMLPEISSEEKKGKLGQNIQWRFSAVQAELLSRQLTDYPNKLIHKKKALRKCIDYFGWKDRTNLPWGRFPMLINDDQIYQKAISLFSGSTSRSLHADNPSMHFSKESGNDSLRNQLISLLRQKNIFLGTWYKNPIEAGSKKLEFFGYESGMCPLSEKIGKSILNLPINDEVDLQEIISNIT